MTERETISRQAGQGQNGINEVSTTPPQRRRRSRKKKKSNIKKYFEWLMWAVMIGIFIATIAMLFKSASVKDSGVKKKGAVAGYHSPWPVA